MADRTITSELLKTYGVDRDLPCPSCGYNLRGNAGGRCPECGKNVASYLKKMSVSGEQRRIIHLADVHERLIGWLGPPVLLLLAGGFWAAVHVSNPPVIVDRGVAIAMVIMVLAAADAWRRLTRRLWRRKGFFDRVFRTLVIWMPGLAAVGALVAFLTAR